MKKSTKIIIAVAVVAIIIVAVIGVIAITKLAKEKNAITAEEFKTKMENKDYVVLNAIAQFEGFDYVKQVYIASPSDYTYQIEFYEFTENEYAQSFYNNSKNIFENRKGSASADTEVNLSNHSKYTLSSNGKYYAISRVGNTAIYIEVNDTYRDTVKDVLKKLGY